MKVDDLLTKLEAELYITNEFGCRYQNPEARLTDELIAAAEKQFNINTNTHRMCVNCQCRQLVKYNGFKKIDPISEEVTTVNSFEVPCGFVPKTLPAELAAKYQQLLNDGRDPKIAEKVIMSAIDPVAWAELMFGFDDDTKDTDDPWFLRSYQKEQLRCNTQRLVVREGRRSGKTFIMALKLIYYVFNKITSKGRSTDGRKIEIGPEIMVITPFQSQLITIFNEMEKLLKRNPDLMRAVVKSSGTSLYTKTPNFKMQFINDAVITGYVSGVGTKADGSGGGTMRGASASVIYLDEMDLIPEETIEKVIMPILLSDLKGEVVLMATSTPIGKRSFFHSWCLEAPDWKEDHLPSTVLPQWDRIKKMILAKTTKIGLMTEYMAEFIDSQYGVFKPSHVHRCRKAYTYDDISDPRWWRNNFSVSPKSQEIIKCIGIDWNKNAGTEYVVVAYIPQTHSYVILESLNISASEMSGSKWKTTLRSLNFKWRPDYIYADEGYGHTIIEDMITHATGLMSKKNKTEFDRQTILIKDRLKSVNFSSKIELTNPVDNTIFTKPAKEFLVENAQRIVEEEGPDGAILWIPEDERVLVDQMLNYKIEKLNAKTGKPVYGPDNAQIGDHRLDAFMLAVAGIAIEAGMYGSNNIAFSGMQYSPDYQVNKNRNEKAYNPFTLIKNKLHKKNGRQDLSPGHHRHGNSPLSAWDNAPQVDKNYDPDNDYQSKNRPRRSSQGKAGKYRRSF